MANRALEPWTGSRALSPFGRDPFTSFRREMDRLFDDFFQPVALRGGESRSFAALEDSWPTLDVDDTQQAYVITAEVPGMEQKNIELDLRDNVLTISGERQEERKDDGKSRAYAERFYGRFRRSIPLAAEVDADKAAATFKNGVLTVTLPKSTKPEAGAHRIAIKG